MKPKICFVGFLDANQAHVERGAENPAKSVLVKALAVLLSESELVQLLSQGHLAVPAGGIKFKGFLDKRCAFRVGSLGFSCASIEITERSRHWIKALLEPSIETFLCFLPKITDVISCDHRLNISREPAAARTQIQRFVDKVNLGATVNEFAQFGPIFEVSGRAINLVHQHARGFSSLQQAQHFRENWPSAFGGCFLLFKMLNNLETLPGSMPLNRIKLLCEGNALTLPRV